MSKSPDCTVEHWLQKVAITERKKNTELILHHICDTTMPLSIIKSKMRKTVTHFEGYIGGLFNSPNELDRSYLFEYEKRKPPKGKWNRIHKPNKKKTLKKIESDKYCIEYIIRMFYKLVDEDMEDNCTFYYNSNLRVGVRSNEDKRSVCLISGTIIPFIVVKRGEDHFITDATGARYSYINYTVYYYDYIGRLILSIDAKEPEEFISCFSGDCDDV